MTSSASAQGASVASARALVLCGLAGATVAALAVAQGAHAWTGTYEGTGDFLEADIIGYDCPGFPELEPPNDPAWTGIRGVEGLGAYSNVHVASGSVEDYILTRGTPPEELAGFYQPEAFEGPSDGTADDDYVHFGGGKQYVVGRLTTPIEDLAGPELTSREWSGQSAMVGGWCMYGSKDPKGPFVLIGGNLHMTPLDGHEEPHFDLATHYTRLSGWTEVEYVAVQAWSWPNPVFADFEGPVTAYEGVPVSFEDTSWQVSYFIHRWDWDFGDGGTSTKQNPSHTFAAPGTYDVCLTATDEAKYNEYWPSGPMVDAVCKEVVVLPQPPVADFSWAVDPAQPFRWVDFVDLSQAGSYPIVDWHWEVETKVYNADPRHLFPDFSSYPVTLTVTDAEGQTDSVTKPVHLENLPPGLNAPDEVYVYLGRPISFNVQPWDADGHPLVSTEQLPPDAQMIEDYFLWWPDTLGTFPARFEVEEQYWSAHRAEHTTLIRVIEDSGDDESGIVPDMDNDGIEDKSDNCPGVQNHFQEDSDHDGRGDACDGPVIALPSGAFALDTDRDGIQDAADNCPRVKNPQQGDLDRDGLGDVCDKDIDGDRVANSMDLCPLVPDPPQVDLDGNGVGDVCDAQPQPKQQEGGSPHWLIGVSSHPDQDGRAVRGLEILLGMALAGAGVFWMIVSSGRSRKEPR